MTKTKHRGRPKQNIRPSPCQQNILTAAKRLFLKHAYSKVTTRQIASEANVDVALISYYFGNKAELYKAVFDDIYTPFFEKLTQIKKSCSSRNTIEELFLTIFELDIEHPELLTIIYKTLVLNDGPKQSYFNQQILNYTDAFHITIFSQLQHDGYIHKEFDIELLKDSFNALVMMPFFFYSFRRKDSSKEETSIYLKNLYQQNVRLFLHGCMVDTTLHLKNK